MSKPFLMSNQVKEFFEDHWYGFKRLPSVLEDLLNDLKYRFGLRQNLKLDQCKPGQYYDHHELVIHGAFQPLVTMIEKDGWFKVIDWQHHKDIKVAYRKFMKLYYWYTRTRPNRPDPFDEAFKRIEHPDWTTEPSQFDDKGKALTHKMIWTWPENDPRWGPYREAGKKEDQIEKAYEIEDTSQLKRLAHIRRWLWT